LLAHEYRDWYHNNYFSGKIHKLSEELKNKNRVYRLPGRNLPDVTREKLRHRRYRSRLTGLSKMSGPLKTLGFALLLVSLGYLAITQLRHLFFNTSYFELKKIEVVGYNNVSKQEILTLSGASPGMNVFFLDKEKLRKNILAHPQIKSVKVELDGLYVLKFQVEEREPVMYAKVGTAFYEIAEDGIIINTDALGYENLPIVTGLRLETFRAGDSLKADDGFYLAQHWINSLEKKNLEKISEINFSNPQNPYLFLDSGIKVYPKSLEDFKNRFTFLRALLDNLRENNVEPIYLDMRAPNIVVRPKKNYGVSEGSRGSVAGG
jgi:cell division protein FtsQ